MSQVRNTGRGAVAGRVGALLGLLPAVALGMMRLFIGEGPVNGERLAGDLSLALLMAVPYALALVASRVPDPGVRGGVLFAIGLLSLAACVSLIITVAGVFFLPATLVLLFAAVRSLTAASRPLTTVLPATAGGLLLAAIVGVGFYALIFVQDPAPRCWERQRGPDGWQEWQSRPAPADRLGGSSISSGPYGSLSRCTSDIETWSESAVGLAAVATASLLLLPVVRLRPSPF